MIHEIKQYTKYVNLLDFLPGDIEGIDVSEKISTLIFKCSNKYIYNK
jgi:hypothetical protein